MESVCCARHVVMLIILCAWFPEVSSQASLAYYRAGTNCNCGIRLKDFATEASSKDKCAAKCTATVGCVSFGFWTSDALSKGHCALYPVDCPVSGDGWTPTSTCVTPTTRGVENNVNYNKGTRPPTVAPTASPTPFPTTPRPTAPTAPTAAPTSEPQGVGSGNTASATGDTTLTASTPSPTAAVTLFAGFDAIGDPEGTLDSLANVAASLLGGGGVSDETLLAMLDAVSTSSSVLGADASQAQVRTVSEIIENLVTVSASSHEPGAVSGETVVKLNVAEKAASTILSFTGVISQGSDGLEVRSANNLAGSIALLIESVDVEERRRRLSNSIDGQAQRKQELGKQLVSCASTIGDAVVSRAAVGASVTVQARDLKITAQKQTASAVAATGKKFGNFEFPPLPGIAQGSVVFQQKKWPRNPYALAGAQGHLVDTAKSGIDADTLTVNEKGIVSMDIRSDGQILEVNGLATEIVFELELAHRLRDTHSEAVLCQYFDEKTQSWTDHGCRVVNSTTRSVLCACTHLSSFTSALAQIKDFAQSIIECSYADLLSSQALSKIGVGNWAGRSLSVCLWMIWGCFASLLILSIVFERDSRKSWGWSTADLIGEKDDERKSGCIWFILMSLASCLECCIPYCPYVRDRFNKKVEDEEEAEKKQQDMPDEKDKSFSEKMGDLADGVQVNVAVFCMKNYAQGKLGVTKNTVKSIAKYIKQADKYRGADGRKKGSRQGFTSDLDDDKLLDVYERISTTVKQLSDHDSMKEVTFKDLVGIYWTSMQPLMTMSHFCINIDASMRLMLCIVQFCGALMASALFYNAGPPPGTKCNPASAGKALMTDIMVAAACALISMLPPKILAYVARRNIKQVASGTSINSILIKWRVRAALVWIFATACLAFSIIFIMSFLANEEEDSADHWFVSSLVSLLQTQILVPGCIALLLASITKADFLAHKGYWQKAWIKLGIETDDDEGIRQSQGSQGSQSQEMESTKRVLVGAKPPKDQGNPPLPSGNPGTHSAKPTTPSRGSSKFSLADTADMVEPAPPCVPVQEAMQDQRRGSKGSTKSIITEDQKIAITEEVRSRVVA